MTRPCNPYRRGTTESICAAPQCRSLSTEALCDVLREMWAMAVDVDDEDANSIWSAAARIRWGARQACARLRAERDAARKQASVAECDSCGETAMTSRGAKMADELRTLRRELAARRAVDGWIQSFRCILEVDHCGRLHVRGPLRGPFHIESPDYPALATALGIDWEETK